MKFLLALLLWPSIAFAQLIPACLPSTVGGTGTKHIYAESDVGFAVGWWCANEKKRYVYWARWDELPGNWRQQGSDAVVSGSFNSFFNLVTPAQKNANGQFLTPADLEAPIHTVWFALNAIIYPPIPTEVWTVVPYAFRADGARPIFPIVNGKRSATPVPNEFAPKGSACDPSIKFVEPAGTYAGVRGNPNWVALCAKQP